MHSSLISGNPFSNLSINFLSLIVLISSEVYTLPVVGSYFKLLYLLSTSLELMSKLINKSKNEINEPFLFRFFFSKLKLTIL